MEEVLIKIKRKTIDSGCPLSVYKEINEFLKNEQPDGRFEQIKATLEANHHKMTAERKTIIKAAQKANRLFTIDEVHKIALKNLFICKSSIANTISILEQHNIIQRHEVELKFGKRLYFFK